MSLRALNGRGAKRSDIMPLPMAECEYALRVSGPEDAGIEVSIDGAPYRPCRHSDGQWVYRWAGTLSGHHHMVVVIRGRT